MSGTNADPGSSTDAFSSVLDQDPHGSVFQEGKNDVKY